MTRAESFETPPDPIGVVLTERHTCFVQSGLTYKITINFYSINQIIKIKNNHVVHPKKICGCIRNARAHPMMYAMSLYLLIDTRKRKCFV